MQMSVQEMRMGSHMTIGAEYLTEQIVGSFTGHDIFCSLLFDRLNRTLRVIDFKSGKFAPKREYLKSRVKAAELRKIFTLVEFGEVKGWRSIGYNREGTIPAYFNRSDAHIMSCNYNDEYDVEEIADNDRAKLKSFLREVEHLSAQVSKKKSSRVQVDRITEAQAIAEVGKELRRRAKSANGKVRKNAPEVRALDVSVRRPIFCQFGRGGEFLYFNAVEVHSEKTNIFGAECQNNFGNAKVDIFFAPENTSEAIYIRSALVTIIELLRNRGVNSVYTMAPEDTPLLSALYASIGFCNTGRLYRQRLNEHGPQNLLLWTSKLDSSKP